MCPRGRRSESITLPAGNHPGLPRYIDEKSLILTSEEDSYLDSDDDYDFVTDDSDSTFTTFSNSSDSSPSIRMVEALES